MNLLEFSDDILECILGMLDVRSLLAAEASCTTLRRLGSRVTLQSMTVIPSRHQATVAWVTSRTRDNASRVKGLVASRCLHNSTDAHWVRHLTSLESFEAWFCRLSPGLLYYLPSGLQHLHIHRLSLGACASKSFATNWIPRSFPRLQSLRVTFMPEYDIITLDNVSALHSLRDLEFRGPSCTTSVHTLPPSLTSLHLESMEILCASSVQLPEKLRVLQLASESALTDIPLESMMPTSMPDLEVMSVTCQNPARMAVPFDRTPGLRTMAVEFQVAMLPNPAEITGVPHLRRLDMRASRCFVWVDSAHGENSWTQPHSHLARDKLMDLHMTGLRGGVPCDIKSWLLST